MHECTHLPHLVPNDHMLWPVNTCSYCSPFREQYSIMWYVTLPPPAPLQTCLMCKCENDNGDVNGHSVNEGLCIWSGMEYGIWRLEGRVGISCVWVCGRRECLCCLYAKLLIGFSMGQMKSRWHHPGRWPLVAVLRDQIASFEGTFCSVYGHPS